MRLSKEQIQQLYTFTRQHYVEYYDVQTELVDHLANDIEQIWDKNPNLSFEQAKDISFKKFGVFGFMDVVEARQNAMNKKYWKLVWKIFKEYFKIPQIFSMFAFFSILFTSFLVLKEHRYIYITLGIGICTILLIRLIRLHKLKKKRFKQTGRKWIFEEYILNSGNIGAFSYIYFQIPLQLKIQLQSVNTIGLVSLFFTFFVVMTYIILFVLPSKIEKILENQYPEYKLV